MKTIKLLPLALLFLVSSCSSVKVAVDYDTTADFSKYKTFAFYKKGIDKVDLSDLDKRRILKAIEKELLTKGFTKSNKPDVLVSIFTKARKKVDIYSHRGYRSWYPWYYGPNYGMHISKYTEGTLFVDLIDTEKKMLVWQGMGTGAINTSKNIVKKEARINAFVAEIMAKYPPAAQK